ncbi:MAG: PVC-type heme-binding CxxCH protein, partial [Pirellulaceae bacterium]|nr:PVC-type heme-binding CxxCH protein [Pirellulaceae bacterium]
MKRKFVFAVLTVFMLLFSFGLPVTIAAEVSIGKYQFRIADGFTVELIAAPPMVKYPICADFDERGRFYVCESSGSIDWNKPQSPDSMHRVLRLEDSDGDGIFDRSSVYAQFEMMPQGSMWLDGSLFVAAAPLIWKLTDTDDDGIADVREEWVKTDKTTNCLNDLRGPYLGPDGYIYWSKGPALQEYMVDGKPWASSARHIMRRHPKGTNAEPLMVGGMDNPIEIAFTPGGQRMITCTYIQPPGQPRDDGILHAIYGGVYPKDIAPIYDFPWTGPDVLTPLTTWGAVSPAGLMCYQSTVFGDAFQGNLFSAHFNGHRVFRHAMKPKGSTFECTNEELIGSDNVEFHPTEVMEDADGSLIVIETGGWYRNCCPSSTFYRPDVDGAIYRIRRTNAKPIDDPRGLNIAWNKNSIAESAKYLEDQRPAVRRRSIEELAKLGSASLPALESTLANEATAVVGKLSAIWTSVRIEDENALELIRRAMKDSNSEVRQAAISSSSLRRDHKAMSELLRLLRTGDMHDQRLAAEALGRLRDPAVVPALLTALEIPCDRNLDHALIYALIEIGNSNAIFEGVKSKNDRVRRASMIALDQLPDRKLDPQVVLKELNAADSRMQETAWWIVSRHPKEWGGLMTDHLRRLLVEATNDPAKQNALRLRLARLIHSPDLAEWTVQELTASSVSSSTQMLLLKAMGDAGGQNAEPSWVEALLQTLRESGRNQELAVEVIATLAKLPPLRTNDQKGKQLAGQLNKDLLSSALDAQFQPSTRLRALTSIKGSVGNIDDDLLTFLLPQMAPEQPFEIRSAAADAIARAKLTETQQSKLAGSLKNLALSELNVVLTALQGSQNDEIGQRLVNSLFGSSSADSLNAFRLKTLLSHYSASVQKAAKPLLDRLEKSQAEQLAKAERVSAMVAEADPRRGLQVFSSQKAACTACHKAANVGGITGPSLKGIGARRSERDLIESIIFPNA